MSTTTTTQRTVFVTKYALTRGVFTQECSRVADDTGGPVYWSAKNVSEGFYREGSDCFLTEEEARQNVKKKMEQKMKKMKKDLAKVEADLKNEVYRTMPFSR